MFRWEGVDDEGCAVGIEVFGVCLFNWQGRNQVEISYPTHEQAFAAADALAKSLANKDADRDATEVK